MNRFRAGQGQCRANLHKWGLAQSPSRDCGQRQTMNHIVDTCPLTKFEAGLNLLHKADDLCGFVYHIIVRTPNALDALVTREQVHFK